MTEKTLFITEVGSFMWGMGTPESDHDYIQIFQQPTYDILAGYAFPTSKPHREFVENGVEYDYQYMEVGHLVNLLLKGNINAIWAVTSPIVVQEHCALDFDNLRRITLNNLSKASYASISGMASSQLLDSTRRPKATNMNKNKAYTTCLRTLNFGIRMFTTGELVYAPVNYVPSLAEIKVTFDETLRDAYKTTLLPDKPNEHEFRDFLYYLRARDM
jgi:predicted nucleotidyltransferase